MLTKRQLRSEREKYLFTGRPDSRGAPGSFKCPVYSSDTLHPQREREREREKRERERERERGERDEREIERERRGGSGRCRLPGRAVLVHVSLDPLALSRLSREERERERTFFFLSGMLMLTIPLIRSDPHSDKGNTCRLAVQGLQFNVKRNKAQACKEKN
ncbi:hypothetical protein DPMN_127067 [Dreissena polymorpha]|uniref:Uncharacterized protein n=1 Tax=Dreissena polymorpha TaxID=45954 RepID=A0A9D4H1B4_DREPO|nr:hypothetical protein DPMN_127067 [Dreissena polymorpha]